MSTAIQTRRLGEEETGSAEQAELPLKQDAPRVVVTALDVAILESAIRQSPGRTREELAALIGWSERHVRATAERSRDILRAPGLRGYYLISASDSATIYAAANRWRAQFRCMEQEFIRLSNIAGAKCAAEKLCPAAEVIAQDLSSEYFHHEGTKDTKEEVR
jgi:hypothetical protein